jgi:hypothetical protein
MGRCMIHGCTIHVSSCIRALVMYIQHAMFMPCRSAVESIQFHALVDFDKKIVVEPSRCGMMKSTFAILRATVHFGSNRELRRRCRKQLHGTGFEGTSTVARQKKPGLNGCKKAPQRDPQITAYLVTHHQRNAHSNGSCLTPSAGLKHVSA